MHLLSRWKNRIVVVNCQRGSGADFAQCYQMKKLQATDRASFENGRDRDAARMLLNQVGDRGHQFIGHPKHCVPPYQRRALESLPTLDLPFVYDEEQEFVPEKEAGNLIKSLLALLDSVGALHLEDRLFTVFEYEQKVGGVRLAVGELELERLMLYAHDQRREDRAKHEVLFQSTFVLNRLGLEPAAVHHSDVAFRRARDDDTRGRTKRLGGHMLIHNGAGRRNNRRRSTLNASATQTDTLPRV